MDVLEQMGVQRWRLKPGFQVGLSKADQQAKTPAEPTTPSDSISIAEATTVVEVPTAVEVPIAVEAEAVEASTAAPTNTPKAAPEATDSAVDYSAESILPPAQAVVAPEPDEAIYALEQMDWRALQDLISSTTNCPSCSQNNSLLGVGNAQADWLFVVDAPSQLELQEGRLLVGRAGRLFDAMLHAIGLVRDNIYCSSVFKCAPTEDLSSSPQCDAILHRQIQLLQPKVVVTFGEFAAQKVVRANEPLALLRESAQQCYQSKVSIVPTYSPAEMLKQPSLKAMVWQDLKRALALAAA